MSQNVHDDFIASLIRYLNAHGIPARIVPRTFNERYGIGRTKYSVHFHNGVETHKDGSPFYDCRLFKNKVKKEKFVKELQAQGYTRE